MNSIACTIVLPCYNPPHGWAQTIVENYRKIAEAINGPIEVILVNDGSDTGISGKDITLLEGEIPVFRFISYTNNRGKGYAVRQGVAQAGGRYIIYTDVDFPYTTCSVLKIYTALTGGVDVAVGIKNKEYYAHVPAARRYISKLLRACTALFFRIKITDTQCGLKGLREGPKQEFLSTTIDRYLFDLEFIRRVSGSKYNVQPVEVTLNDNIRFSHMNYKILAGEMLNFFKMFLFSK